MRRLLFIARPMRLLAVRLFLVLSIVSLVGVGLLSNGGSSASVALPSASLRPVVNGFIAPQKLAGLPMPTSAAAAPPDAYYDYAEPAPGKDAGAAGGTFNAARGYDAPTDALSPSIRSGTTAATTYQSPLTAGLVNDNDKFTDYLDYLRNYQGPLVHPVPVEGRMFVRVLDADQHPVAGARVQLFDGDRAVFDGRTVSDGRVLFLPQAAEATQAPQFRVVITRGQQQVEGTIKAGTADAAFSLADLKDNSGSVGLDIVFLLDATGSMGDEIDHIKATIDTIASRIAQMPGSSAPRLGLVAFRDQGDEYVTRSWDFTADVQQFAANLANVQAGGGGDTPESVNAGLHDAIHLPGWTQDGAGRHLKLIFLVGDATPHLDYANDYEYTTLLNEAVGAGIKLFPIGASGLEDQGEYIFRQFAQITQGQFVFLTYANGVSGAPGVSTDKHVSDFTVNQLDSLVVNLVAGEIAAQTGQAPQAQAPNPIPVVGDVLTATPLATSPLMTLAQQVSRFAEQSNLGFWLAALLVVVWWARRAPGRARHAAATSTDSPATPAPAYARLEPTPADAVPLRPAAFVASAAYPASDVVLVGADAVGRATAPLPALPPDVTARMR